MWTHVGCMHAAVGITMKHTVEDDVQGMIDDQMETAITSVRQLF